MTLLYNPPGKLVLPQAMRSPIQFPVAPYIYIGARRLAGYKGPCYDVQPLGGGTTKTIGFRNTDHVVDWQAAANAVGAPVGQISKAYDQSGNALSPTMATAANMPVFHTDNRHHGMLPITFDGNNLTDDTFIPAAYKALNFPTISMGSRAGTIFCVLRPKTVGDGGQIITLQNSSSQGIYNFYWVGAFFAGMPIEVYNSPANTNYDYSVIRSDVVVIGFAAGASNVLAYFDNEVDTYGVWPTGQTATKGSIGGDVADSFAGTYDLLAFVAFNTALTSTQMSQVGNILADGYGSNIQYDGAVLCDGDSRMAGFGVDYNQGMMDVTRAIMTRRLVWANIAVSGQKAQDCYTNYTSNARPIIQAWADQGVKTVYVCEQGVNDAASGTSAATIYNSYIKPILASARSDGAKTVCCTIIHETGDSGTEATIINALNVLIKAGFTNGDFDALCDMDVIFPSGPAVPAYSKDGTHANNAGNELLRGPLAIAISQAFQA